MRIITGKAKGMVLQTLEGEITRPTSQRVKEAIFSMLQFDIGGANILDVFAGCGQLSIEALSRGAKHATMNDISKEAVGIIKANVKKAKMNDQCDIYNLNYETFLKRINTTDKYDIVFIDPPYKLNCISRVLKYLQNEDLISNGAYIVCETGSDDIFQNNDEIDECFEIYRQTKYSISYVTILKPKEKIKWKR